RVRAVVRRVLNGAARARDGAADVELDARVGRRVDAGGAFRVAVEVDAGAPVLRRGHPGAGGGDVPAAAGDGGRRAARRRINEGPADGEDRRAAVSRGKVRDDRVAGGRQAGLAAERGRAATTA